MLSFFKKITESLINKDFGETIKIENIGKSMKFLFILMILIGSLKMTYVVYELNNFAERSKYALTNDFPDFEIIDGKFICNSEMPFISKMADNSVIHIDTENPITDEILNEYESGFFISEDKILVKKNAIETRSYNLKDIKGFDINKYKILDIAQKFIIPIIIVVFIFGVLLIYIGKLLGVLFFSLIGLLINLIIKYKLTYSEILKISIYAIILPTFVDNLISLFSFNIPYFFVIYYSISIFYFVRFVLKYEKAEIKEVELEK